MAQVRDRQIRDAHVSKVRAWSLGFVGSVMVWVAAAVAVFGR